MAKQEVDIKKTPEDTLDPNFVEQCKSIKSKRARTVIDHILKFGIITTEELSSEYEYEHPPRAIRDVRDNGIPIITYKVKSKKTNRKIAAYTFGNPKQFIHGRIGGRKNFPKKFKQKLIDKYGAQDAFTGEYLDAIYLQIDHRIPYAIAGDDGFKEISNYMLLDASSQRSKSWSCEHCKNFNGGKNRNICSKCFWANPQCYTHICAVEKRRIDIIWTGDETKIFDALNKICQEKNITIQEFIKAALKKLA